jgi:hypothetical protein
VVSPACMHLLMVGWMWDGEPHCLARPSQGTDCPCTIPMGDVGGGRVPATAIVGRVQVPSRCGRVVECEGGRVRVPAVQGHTLQRAIEAPARWVGLIHHCIGIRDSRLAAAAPSCPSCLSLADLRWLQDAAGQSLLPFEHGRSEKCARFDVFGGGPSIMPAPPRPCTILLLLLVAVAVGAGRISSSSAPGRNVGLVFAATLLPQAPRLGGPFLQPSAFGASNQSKTRLAIQLPW